MSEPTRKVLRDLERFLCEITVAALGTVDERGLPYVVNLYVAPDDQLRFYFVSDPESAHAQHIAREPAVSLAGYAPIRMWQQVRGIQIRGRCKKVPAAQRDAVWAIYHARFPHIDEVAEYLRSMDFYCVTPETIRWIDNSVHFGFEVDLNWPLSESLAISHERHGLV
ncbi:MAG: pyridoxamine 5'-phosphate oxidase family protein [Phycisphaeraceae bacterium]